MPYAFQATLTLAPPLARSEASPAARLPGWMRAAVRRMQRPRADLLDRSTGLYNRAGLMAAANEALALQSGAGPAAFSIIVLDFADLREVWEIYGTAVASKVLARVVRRIRSLAGWHGFAGRTGPAQFTVILPGQGEERARDAVRRVLGKPARVEFDAGESEIVLVPDLLVDSAEPGTPRVQELYRESCRELARAQKDERRRLHYLASERERHSRPMGLPASR